MRRLGVVLLGFGLIGCGSTAREQIAVVGRNADAAMGGFGECRASLHANPAYADLVGRTATRADAPDSASRAVVLTIFGRGPPSRPSCAHRATGPPATLI